MNRSHWAKDLTLFKPDDSMFLWLTRPYVLTHALKRVCHVFEVQVIEQRFALPFEDEQSTLHLEPGKEAFVRQVFLTGDDRPLVYARVTIPWQTYQAYEQDFKQLGAKPLGETLLYNRPEMTREPFEYACLADTHGLVKSIPHLQPDPSSSSLWARRSLFRLAENPLLVTEIFLPTLPSYVE